MHFMRPIPRPDKKPVLVKGIGQLQKKLIKNVGFSRLFCVGGSNRTYSGKISNFRELSLLPFRNLEEFVAHFGHLPPTPIGQNFVALFLHISGWIQKDRCHK